MRSILTFGAAALALAISSAPAMAQGAAQSDDAATAPAGESSPAASSPMGADASATASTLAVGATVKDKTGASIGEVTAVKPDPTGKQVATIKMGADSFAVETDKLAIADGSATINATQAELKAMLGK